MQIIDDLSSQEYLEIQRLMSTVPDQDLNIHQLWKLMDLVWDEMGCDNMNLDWSKISEYYRHPIWLLNGFFIEQHAESLQHRHAISDWIAKAKLQKVLDFGGGFGTLARMIGDKSPQTIVHIYEPYPSNVAISRCQNYINISFVNSLAINYDCLVSTDVLEHVSDPLDMLAKMIAAVDINGYLIIANHFFPCIKCHLPKTFHFRYSFDQFAEVMGLTKVGSCDGSHATIYQKTANKPLNWSKIRRMETRSQVLFLWREFDHKNFLPWRLRWKRLQDDPINTLRRFIQKLNRLS
jgi:2-polyprenyl-3-methyl-5-hydroxy-6-metoxy-1,4-benzoquinol methylase